MEPGTSQIATDTDSPTSNGRRRRLAVSLRAMMALVLVVAVWCAWQVNRARAVRRAIQSVQELGGHVEFDSPFDKAGNWKSWIHPPKWLYRALGEEYLSDVSTVMLRGTFKHPNRSESIRAIRSFPRLKRLSFLSVELCDADIAVIGGLAELEHITVLEPEGNLVSSPMHVAKENFLGATPVQLTPDGWKHVAGLRRLQSITLNSRRGIDPSALEAWSSLPNLENLDLSRLDLTDTEVLALGKFKRLRQLQFGVKSYSDILERRWRVPIGEWGEMQRLWIRGLPLNADEFRATRQLSKLVMLSLSSAGIRNEDLLLLREQTSLKYLMLFGNHFSQEAVDTLKAALPKVRVFRP